MHRESHCDHDIAEQETAVAEHLCPLCLHEKLEAVRGLVDKWRNAEPYYGVGGRVEQNRCADELEAVLNRPD